KPSWVHAHREFESHLFRQILVIPDINSAIHNKYFLLFKIIRSKLIIVAILLLLKEKNMADKSQKKKESKGKPKKAK
ncbi:MAG: hypothetical protein VW238_04970, partial [Nitrosomonadales bacterium]